MDKEFMANLQGKTILSDNSSINSYSEPQEFKVGSFEYGGISKDMDKFPYNVIFYNEKTIDMLIHQGKLDKMNKKLSDKTKYLAWNEERGNACRGTYGLPARIASMSAGLWFYYNTLKSQNIDVTLDMIKDRLNHELAEHISKNKTLNKEDTKKVVNLLG